MVAEATVNNTFAAYQGGPTVRIEIRYLTTLLAAVAVSAAVLLAPVAAAAPECTNTGPRTTQCQTRGSTQIVTSPPAFTSPWLGWPFGGFGFGIGIGF